ncbi:TPA: hypothetical protein DCR49_09530 [Candidatus Delongbacteria bacterium]|nr:MAG: hypothetical protein A2Y39_00740 [Candidatus Delongbacteria bacterium GWF2_40_14]HAQ62216.1 hypothetical protein [Candidatus Delongbacteria bacterium]
MKKIYIPFILLLVAAVAFTIIKLNSNSLDSKLDDLEGIIDKYEPQFDAIEYESKEYSEMIIKYNEEIFAWAEAFERERYIRDKNGRITYDYANKPILNKEFNSEVEKRFYEINNRMTRMVLRKIPKKEKPADSPNDLQR